MRPEDMLHNHARRTARPRETLFEFVVGHYRYRCELRDYGAYGIEAQFFENEQCWYSRRFDGRLDPTPLVTHQFTLDDIEEAFDLFSHQRNGILKVALYPGKGHDRRLVKSAASGARDDRRERMPASVN